MTEALEADEFRTAARAIDGSEGPARARAVLEFTLSCLTAADQVLARMLKALEKPKFNATLYRKYPSLANAVERLMASASAEPVRDMLQELRSIVLPKLYRRELFETVRRAVWVWAAGETESVESGLLVVRESIRHTGRRLPRLTAGTCARLKGLEFDHVIVLHPEDMTRNDLYVALTRAKRSLTVVGSQASWCVGADC